MNPKIAALPVASSDNERQYRGHYADIVPNGSSVLPWSIILVSPTGCRRLSDHGSITVAGMQFDRLGLRGL